MPSVNHDVVPTAIPLKISDDGMEMAISYDDPTAWNVTAAPAVVSFSSARHPLWQ